MKSRWSAAEAEKAAAGPAGGDTAGSAAIAYASRLLGADPALVLHGGGNTSVKTTLADGTGAVVPALLVKASGVDLASIGPEGFVPLDLAALLRLRPLAELDDLSMVHELRRATLWPGCGDPSIEALVHAFLPARVVLHTHADSILALTNRRGGEATAREALGGGVLVLPYVEPGFRLAKAAAKLADSVPGAIGMVWSRHGVVTWGDDEREAYERMIDVVTRAEHYLDRRAVSVPVAAAAAAADPATAARVQELAPILRGALSPDSGDADRPKRPVVLRSLTDPAVRAFVDASDARTLALTPPLTSDHLIRTKARPLFLEGLAWGDAARLREQVAAAVADYAADYAAYIERGAARLPDSIVPFDPLPRVALVPGVGAFCAGSDARAAAVAADITAHTVAVKARVGGEYEGLSEEQLFDMEYKPQQHAKLARRPAPLAGAVALITGAAGAIGAGVARGLLDAGCAVAVTDLPGAALDGLAGELRREYPHAVLALPLDVTDEASVARASGDVVRAWGGIDLVVVNAGIAHVSPLASMELEAFRRLERVNVEGTLLVLREAARLFELQRTGGDVVLVSTKNVFAPGATFGAYSATKAASHQLARIASLELAALGVRVNMVAPDAVFGDASRRSGLWAEVGPGRMRARGLDEAGLEEYYRQRNLLKVRVTAEHVARAVLFFATRQTPTTGATIPVDGGLPDATPR